MSRVYVYVVDRDFGFAPNPFHGCCTLATCKPGIRAGAQLSDWIIGVGGSRLRAFGRCIFAMRVTDTLSFTDYWNSPSYFDKRPVRNGSSRMMVGDNIYHWVEASRTWSQADSHHSNSDGSPNPDNIEHDTKADRVLISSHFFYFGRNARVIPVELLDGIGYRNGRNYRVFQASTSNELLAWLHGACGSCLNRVCGDPFDFESSGKRYSARTNRIT